MKVLTLFKQFQPYEKFCLPELKALLSPYNLPLSEVFQHENFPSNFFTDPYLIKNESFATFPNVYITVPKKENTFQLLSEICQRSVTVECFLDVIGEGATYDQAIQSISMEKWGPLLQNSAQKICFTVTGQNATFSKREQVSRINAFMDGLKMQGDVDLNSFTHEYMIVEQHEECYTRIKDDEKGKTRTLKHVFFGLVVARQRGRKSKQSFYYKYDLTDRAYLAPTSTDNTLAFLMANQAVVRTGQIVFDPFVGSASLLIPPAHFGALCFGQDLDSRILHGTGVGRFNKQSIYYQQNQQELQKFKPRIMINFQQYGLNRPEIIRQDTVLANLRFVDFFDAIICDPPYGMRALTRKTGKRESGKIKNPSVQEDLLRDEDQKLAEERIKFKPDTNIFQQQQYQAETLLNSAKIKQQLQEFEEQECSDQDQDQEDQEEEKEKKQKKVRKNSKGDKSGQKSPKVGKKDKEENEGGADKNANTGNEKKKEMPKPKNKKKKKNADSKSQDSENEGNSELVQQQQQNQQGQEEEETKGSSENTATTMNGPFIQQTKPVEYDQLVLGLLQLACRVLKKDGRLVFLYPVNRNTYKDIPSDFPKHERFQLLDYSESPISMKKSRVLLTMKKLY